MIISNDKLNKMFEEKQSKLSACFNLMETILLHEYQHECQEVSIGVWNRLTLIGFSGHFEEEGSVLYR